MNPVYGIVVAAIGLLLSIYSVAKAQGNNSKAEVKELEGRLVRLESTGVGVKEIEPRLTKLETREEFQRGSLAGISLGIGRLDVQVANLETKVDVFWKQLINSAADLLHQPHPEFARRDYLLEQLRYDKLTQLEAQELYDVLSAVWDNREGPFAERLAASLVMKSLEFDFDIQEVKK